MKNIFQHPPEPPTGKKYWRSLDQLADTPEFRERLEREFPAGAAEFNADGVSRRQFSEIDGRLHGPGRPGPESLPPPGEASRAVHQERGVGHPRQTAFLRDFDAAPPRSAAAGRDHARRTPDQDRGQPLHPVSGGSDGTFAQASLLDLYDPDRSRFFLESGQQSNEAEISTHISPALAAEFGARRGRAGFLVEENNSPTRDRLRRKSREISEGALGGL